MCGIFAGQNQANYEKITRSIRIGGLSTSIRLEARFWRILDELASVQGLTTPRLTSMLYDEVLEKHGEVTNFTSLLRVCCLVFVENADRIRGRDKLAEVA